MVGDTGIEPVTSSVSVIGTTFAGVRWRSFVLVARDVWSWADTRGRGRSSPGCYTGCCQRAEALCRADESTSLHTYAHPGFRASLHRRMVHLAVDARRAALRDELRPLAGSPVAAVIVWWLILASHVEQARQPLLRR